MYQRSDIKEGMTVRSADGHKLGKVYAVGDSEFHIEKGLFFPQDYAVRYAEISELRHGEVVLAHGKESLRSISDEMPYGSDTIAVREGIGTSRVIPGGAELNAGAGEREGLRTPLYAEELEARRRTVGEESEEGTRPLDFSSDDPTRRGL
jgi:hypothetical protein